MNNQTPMKPFVSPEGMLSLHSVFYTIQGEGIFAGHPAYFVRLGGCNIKCPMCDTDYTVEGRPLYSPDLVIAELEELGCREDSLVVITGGEPFRQNIEPFVDELLHKVGAKVQIETNGTLAPTLSRKALEHPQLYIMCSPKINRIHKELQPHISAYKYVLHADHIDSVDGLPLHTLGMTTVTARPNRSYHKPIFVQPVDCNNTAENKRHLQATVEVAMKFNYTLCIQVHKIIGVE